MLAGILGSITLINLEAHVSVLHCKAAFIISVNLLDEVEAFSLCFCRCSLLGSEPPVSARLKKQVITHDDARVGVGSCRLCEAARRECRDKTKSKTLDNSILPHLLLISSKV